MLTPRFLSVGSVCLTVKRKTAGSYVNSRWQEGTETTIKIKANVQPNLSGRDVRTLPEGDRSKKTIKLYTTSDLVMAEQGELLEGDKVLWKGEWWVFLISLLLSSGGFRVIMRKDEEDNQGPKNPYSGDRV